MWGARFKIEYWPGLDLLIRWGLWRGESLIVTVWQCDSPSDISYLSSHLSQNKNYTEFLITESCWDLCVNWTAIICHGNFELIRLQTKRLELRIISIANHWLITDLWYENVSAYLKARNVPSAVWYLCHVPVSCPEVLGTRDWPGLSVIYQCEELAFINQTSALHPSLSCSDTWKNNNINVSVRDSEPQLLPSLLVVYVLSINSSP